MLLNSSLNYYRYPVLFYTVQAEIHSSNINKGNKKLIKDFKASLINSVICSSNTRYCKASTSVIHSFSSNIKIWRPFNINSSSCLHTTPPLQQVTTILHRTDLKL